MGRVYVGTGRGSVFCLETGDPRDDGWTMWGGNARHNGRRADGNPNGRLLTSRRCGRDLTGQQLLQRRKPGL
jgi:hypothetical protein